MKKYLIPAALLLLIIAGVFAYRMYNKPHAVISEQDTAFQLEASTLLEDYTTDEASADAKYLNQVLEVSGTIHEISNKNEGTSLLLDAGSELGFVICELDAHAPQDITRYQAGQSVTLKGICTGYLMDVVLVRCIDLSNQ